MKQFGLKEALIILILSGILAGIYVQSRQTGSETLYHITSLTQKIIAVETTMERDALRLKIGFLQHYDTVAHGSLALDEALYDLKPHVEAIPELAEHLFALEKSILIQKSSMESFKQNNALLRNSLRYFPVAINEAVADNPEPYPFLSHIYNDLLQSMAVPEKMTLKHLEVYVDELNQEGQQALARHLNLIIERYGRIEVNIDAFIHGGLGEDSQTLMLAYESYHDKQMKRSEEFRIALVIYSAFLVIFVGIVMFRLQQAASKLNEANVELQYQKFALDEHAIVAVTDHMGNITYANQRFVDISGYSQSELLGQNHRILKSGYHPKEFYQQMWDTITSGKTWHGEIKNKVKDGRCYWVDATIVPFLNAKGKPYKYVAIRTDISARKETEEAQKKLTTAFYYAAEALMITDSQGSVEHVNPAFEKMTGYSEAEIQGKSAAILRSPKHDEAFFENILETLEKGEVWKGEVNLLCKDRSEKVTLCSRAPVFNANGDVVNHIIFMKDITEEKLLRSKVEHTQRLESLGVLAGGIAHDFNNILTSIMGNAKLAEAKLTGGKREIPPYLSRISKASERAADLCRQMLAYSGQGITQVRPINFSKLVHEIASLLEVSVAENITVHYHLGKQLPAIEADTGQLQQVVMNLITNASESYQDESGEVWIDVGKMHADREWLRTCALGDELTEGDYVYVEVKDSGCGMDEATVKKIFEPFFTTKFTGRGLGMSAMMGIVKAHHGAIHIYSEPGQGTMVRVAFPAVGLQAEPLVDDVPEAGEHSKALIMIVDDEADILEYTESVLTNLGYEVITAVSGEEALEIFQQEERKIDLVITDATMPGMNGEQLCQQLYAIDRDVKLILSSGYDVNDVTEDMQSELLSGFIQKPYSPEKFTHEVYRVLS